MTDLYAVIGQPIAHSQSPRIHAAFAQQTAQDLRYEAIEVASDALATKLAELHRAGYQGLNVTLPHKTAVPVLCESVSERAALASAVNTLIATPTGWRGDNTDGEGLLRDLGRLGYVIKNARVLVLGAGGAVRGILAPLLAAHPKILVVSSRNPWKPEALAEEFRERGAVVPRTHLALKGDQFDLIINATSAGHSGVVPRLPEHLLAAGGACYDLSYGVAFGPFQRWALQQHATKISDGLGMLVEQAAAAFVLWRGVRPDTTAVLTALRAGT